MNSKLISGEGYSSIEIDNMGLKYKHNINGATYFTKLDDAELYRFWRINGEMYIYKGRV